MCRMVAACGALSKPSTRPRRAVSWLYLVGWLDPIPCNEQVSIYVWNIYLCIINWWIKCHPQLASEDSRKRHLITNFLHLMVFLYIIPSSILESLVEEKANVDEAVTLFDFSASSSFGCVSRSVCSSFGWFITEVSCCTWIQWKTIQYWTVDKLT